MRIRNITTGNIIIGDLPNGQGFGVSVPTQVEVLIFNEDAEKSKQLGSFLVDGSILSLGPEEPSTGSPEARTQPAVLGSYQVIVAGIPVAGKALVATSATTADWQSTGGTITFIENEIPAGVINGTNKIFTLVNLPASNSLKLYLNGLRQSITIDYTIAGQTITFVTAPNVPGKMLADYRL